MRARTLLSFVPSAILAIAIAACASGCVSNAGWAYRPNEAQAAPVSLPLVVAVPHFQDQLAEENKTYFWLCVIPLVPYCTASYHRPEAANGFQTVNSYNFRPSEDLATATTDELRQSHIFREVYTTERDS